LFKKLIPTGLLLLLKPKKMQIKQSYKVTLRAFCSLQMKTLKQPYSLFVLDQTSPKAPMASKVKQFN
jgi:hypothetical protein